MKIKGIHSTQDAISSTEDMLERERRRQEKKLRSQFKTPRHLASYEESDIRDDERENEDD